MKDVDEGVEGRMKDVDEDVEGRMEDVDKEQSTRVKARTGVQKRTKTKPRNNTGV